MHGGKRGSRSSSGSGPAARVQARLNSNLAFYLISAQSCVEKIKPEISVGTKRNKHSANAAAMFPETSEVRFSNPSLSRRAQVFRAQHKHRRV